MMLLRPLMSAHSRRWLATAAVRERQSAGHAEARAQVAATSLFLARHAIECMLVQNPAVVADGRVLKSAHAIQRSIDEAELHPYFSKTQTDLLATTPGSWADGMLARYNAMWETQGALLWALQRVDSVPPFVVPFDRQTVFTAAAIQPANIDSVLTFMVNDHIRLTLQDKIEEMRNRAEAWHWRARAYVVQLASQRLAEETKGERLPPGLRSYLRKIDGAITQAAVRASADGLIEFVTEDDFAVHAQAYRDITTTTWQQLDMIAYGRLHALGWILGTYEWDTAPDDLINYASPMAAMFAPPTSDNE